MAVLLPVINALRRIMPIPQLMPEWLRRAATNPIIYAAKKMGSSLVDIKETVDSFLGPTRWLQYGRDISKMVNIASREDMLFGWEKNRAFTQKAIVETYLKGNRNYLVTGRAMLYDSGTKEIWYKNISMYSDTNRTPEEYEELFKNRFLADGVSGENVSLIGIDFTAVLHDARRPR